MKNAQQLHLSGLFLTLAPNFQGPQNISAVIFAEGGPKQIKKYKSLLLRRIKWTEPPGEDDTAATKNPDPDSTTTESCFLVWQGGADRAACPNFKSTFDLKTQEEALALFREKHLEHMWAAVASF